MSPPDLIPATAAREEVTAAFDVVGAVTLVAEAPFVWSPELVYIAAVESDFEVVAIEYFADRGTARNWVCAEVDRLVADRAGRHLDRDVASGVVLATR